VAAYQRTESARPQPQYRQTLRRCYAADIASAMSLPCGAARQPYLRTRESGQANDVYLVLLCSLNRSVSFLSRLLA
jgi:hypothetical protein